MGAMDKVKGFLGGNKDKVSGGIDKAADAAKDRMPDQHDAKIDKAADTAQDQVEKLDES
jgi:hypothetical protein